MKNISNHVYLKKRFDDFMNEDMGGGKTRKDYLNIDFGYNIDEQAFLNWLRMAFDAGVRETANDSIKKHLDGKFDF